MFKILNVLISEDLLKELSEDKNINKIFKDLYLNKNIDINSNEVIEFVLSSELKPAIKEAATKYVKDNNL